MNRYVIYLSTYTKTLCKIWLSIKHYINFRKIHDRYIGNIKKCMGSPYFFLFFTLKWKSRGTSVWTEKWCHCWENFWVNTDRIQNTTNQCYCQYLSLCLNTYMGFFWSDCFKWSIVDSFLQKIATNVKYDNFFLGMHETTLFRKKRFEINFFVRGNASKFAIFIDINQGIHMWKHKGKNLFW